MRESDEQASPASVVSPDVAMALFAFTNLTLFLVMGLSLLPI